MTLTQNNANHERSVANAIENGENIVPMEKGNGDKNLMFQIKNSEEAKYIDNNEYIINIPAETKIILPSPASLTPAPQRNTRPMIGQCTDTLLQIIQCHS